MSKVQSLKSQVGICEIGVVVFHCRQNLAILAASHVGSLQIVHKAGDQPAYFHRTIDEEVELFRRDIVLIPGNIQLGTYFPA